MTHLSTLASEALHRQNQPYLHRVRQPPHWSGILTGVTELLIFALGLIAGAVGGFAGGGAGLFTLPALLLLGISPFTALATARFGFLGQTIGSLGRFLRSDSIKWEMILPLTLLSIPAALIGVYFITSIPEFAIKKIIGVMLLLSAAAMLYKPNTPLTAGKKIGWWSYVAFFFARMIQAALGSGVGLLVNVIYVKMMHLSLTEANATKRIPGLTVILITLIIFGMEGYIDYRAGLFLMAGTTIGSYIGAHYALRANQLYITYAFSTLAIIFGVTLLLK